MQLGGDAETVAFRLTRNLGPERRYQPAEKGPAPSVSYAILGLGKSYPKRV